MSTSKAVKVQNAAIDDTSSGEIILRGVIDADSLTKLQVADYQRERSPLTSLRSLLKAIEEGKPLPDIELGMRGEHYTVRDEAHFLRDDVFIIDGLQRATAMIHFAQANPGRPVHLGATIHFGTTEEWERKRFEILNTRRSRVSPNVILRNMREEYSIVDALYHMTQDDRKFAAVGRVAWTQRMSRGEIITASTLIQTASILHSYRREGLMRAQAQAQIPNLQAMADELGVSITVRNIRELFSVMDEIWGVRAIQYRAGASYMKSAFLKSLARILADHHDFWQNDRKLLIPAPLKRKLKLFPVHDPHIRAMAAGNAGHQSQLYYMIRDHINSGKRTKHLRPRIAPEES